MLDKLDKRTQEELAASLTAGTTELLPFLPYLLQDLWELGSVPEEIASLIKKHSALNEEMQALDLACGKGAVSIKLALEFGARITGVDLIPEFIKTARQKADEFGVAHLCKFYVDDINAAVNRERNYDLAVYGAAGEALGKPDEVINKLKRVIKPGGYIICDDAYLTDSGKEHGLKHEYDYLTYGEWLALFEKAGVKIIDTASSLRTEENDNNTRLITARAEELMKQHPEKKHIFEGYIKSQKDECDDLENAITGITWLLKAE
ncbi:MAG TPA: class I SAM-dependent methyltransferase [Ignavibacteriales bacterium]|nr:class I SAM-dependent methyltransferase [Ignavibacteriales bacterium]